ncbi:1-aminocyclopropane-1-carboxylate deaminase/D-cysteine desulfhydrase [Kordia sp. YSTF-M3]|uniref:1-aminocyclopropane-1-carboxylate deaminase/D-cysteine desulfhydrase n=1 Tax=Kordia aestuariivivens TaxID=2759037 RepID=A0ABR7QDR2_9FLAO|nr:pyridoxal-phosphate dependent enzyme [Kordia aestuariivivens]MBC8756680.1 1-aminocyclopropane-1-carboxylate deaminase/D-cysteine desulfhydrase [Kordia aestuariivivens]
MEFQTENIPIQEIKLDFDTSIRLFIKREDLIHPFVSGNKFRKLTYNLAEAKKEKQHTLLTFGGAFSNHIAAVAAAGKLHGFKTIGIIRGEELVDKVDSNPTLRFAKENGMKFKFVTREKYREKTTSDFFAQLTQEFGRFYSIPEGGTNDLAVKGCAEIIAESAQDFDTICCAVGTGGTIAGICHGAFSHQHILGFPALKGDFLQKEIEQFVSKDNWELITTYHFGGYGKVTDELIQFINRFKQQTGIPLDPIYTGKMLFGIIDLIKKGHFAKQNRILAIHSGGLQGIAGMNQKLQRKGQTTIV